MEIKPREKAKKPRGSVYRVASPEQALLCAIIDRAFYDLNSERIDRAIQRNAAAWILSPSEKRWSFLWMVERLSITSQTKRRILLAAQKKAKDCPSR